METSSTQQEILLMTGSTFFQQQCLEKNERDSDRNLTQREYMEEACWNGLLQEFLPDVVDKDAEGKSLLLWQIKQCEAFLEIDLCNSPVEADDYYSIDPYLFLPEGFAN